MPELGPLGSVRGALSNERPYRDSVRPEPGQHPVGPERYVGVMPEGFALVDVRDMALDDRHLAGVQRVQHGDRGVGEGAGVDDDPGGGDAILVDRVDDLVFAVALAEVDLEAEFARQAPALGFDVRQGLVPIDIKSLLDPSHLVTFIGGVVVGAAAQYVGDKFTDSRRKRESSPPPRRARTGARRIDPAAGRESGSRQSVPARDT